MKLQFKTLSRASFTIDAEPSEKVIDLKKKVAAVQGFDVERQNIIFKGKILDDNLTVEECHFTEKDFIVVMEMKKKKAPAAEAPKPSTSAPEQKKEEPKAEEKPKVEEKKEEKPSADPVKGIPEFWLTCLKTNPIISELITERDEEPLKALTDIQLEYLDDSDGFKLSFFFDKNEYFPDTVLTKVYKLENTGDYGNIIDGKAEGCDIHWNEGKNLTVTVETKKQRRKGTNQTRIIKRTIPAETFFSFFNPPVIPEDEALEMDDDEMQELDSKLEADYEVGEIIKDKIIPYAVDWFTGKALEFEEADFDSDEYDGYVDEDDEDDDDDDDDADNAKINEPAAQTPECKQQ